MPLALALCACEPPREAERPPAPRAVAPPPTAVAPPRREEGAALVRTLFRDDWFGGVTLLGIDAARMRALVRLESQEPSRLVLDTIDLRKGERVDRWEASPEQADRAKRATSFTPLSGGFVADVDRFARMLADLGPWHLRHPIGSPTFAVAPGKHRVLFGGRPTDGSEGDWLFAMTKDGGSRRVDGGLVASYSPVFSPDGERAAFVGCAGSPCDYGLFVVKLSEASSELPRPKRVAGIQRATAPMWTASGDAVLTVGSRAAERCLFRVSADAGSAKSLACVRGLEDVSFTQDPEGRTAAIAGARGVPGKQTVDVTWVLVADGTVLGTQSIDRAVGSSVLNAAGLMAMPMQRGAVGVVDLVSGESQLIPESEGWFFGFEGARWVEDTLVLLRKVKDKRGYDLVAIDVRKAAKRRGDPWL